MKKVFMGCAQALLLSITTVSCGSDFSDLDPVDTIPPNYSQFRNDIYTFVDTLIFTGSFDPEGPVNGTGENILYTLSFPSAAPTTPAPSTLTGTWIGRMGDNLAPQLTLTFGPDELSLTLDCYFSSGNILSGSPAVTLPIVLDGNDVYFSDAFRIMNTDNADIYSFCSFLLNTDYISFSSATGSAVITTTGGTILGTFTQQP